MAAIAQLGERQTEDLKVPGSIPVSAFALSDIRWRAYRARPAFGPTTTDELGSSLIRAP